jgi:hypothetical protein
MESNLPPETALNHTHIVSPAVPDIEPSGSVKSYRNTIVESTVPSKEYIAVFDPDVL